MQKKIIVTGGLGFIGTNLISNLIKNKNYYVINIDSVTYAASKLSLIKFSNAKNYKFIKMDICNNKINDLILEIKPYRLFHLAAESHVDNSIYEPNTFIKTNIFGTFNLLKACNNYLNIKTNTNKNFKFIHVSTDEVYGSLSKNSHSSKEGDTYNPSSPYASSKASSDYLVKSWNITYGFPSVITHCTNNYGPYQNLEKLIPLTIYKLIKKQKIPIYGNGLNYRDWLHVKDHVKALLKVGNKGVIGETYNIGSNNEISNISLVKKICNIFDKKFLTKKKHENYISFVKDRPGHDLRYCLNYNKIKKNLNYKPSVNFNYGLNSTVEWYLKEFNL